MMCTSWPTDSLRNQHLCDMRVHPQYNFYACDLDKDPQLGFNPSCNNTFAIQVRSWHDCVCVNTRAHTHTHFVTHTLQHALLHRMLMAA
jgi:hypothetical protein